MMATRIEDYALLGDGQATALVSKSCSIDWLCWPYFESSPCFAALLGDASNGCWKTAPVDPVLSVERHYVESSLLLATTVRTEGGVIQFTDLLAWEEDPRALFDGCVA